MGRRNWQRVHLIYSLTLHGLGSLDILIKCCLDNQIKREFNSKSQLRGHVRRGVKNILRQTWLEIWRTENGRRPILREANSKAKSGLNVSKCPEKKNQWTWPGNLHERFIKCDLIFSLITPIHTESALTQKHLTYWIPNVKIHSASGKIFARSHFMTNERKC